MLRIRRFAALLLALTLLLVAACSRPASGPAATGAEPAPVSETAIVRILYWPMDEGLINALTAAFYQQNSHIRIEKVLVDLGASADDWTARIKAQATTGEIDLFPTLQVGDLQNRALPIDDRLRSAGIDLKPYGSLLDQLRIDGKLYQLPDYIIPAVIMYNPDLLSRRGVPWPAAGWTWDDLRSDAAKVTSGADASKIWGLSSVMGNANVARVMALERFNSTPVDPEQARQILQYWEALISQDRSAQPDEPRRYADQVDYFSAGRAGMAGAFLPLSRYTGVARNLMFTPGMAPPPTWPGLSPALYYDQSSYAIAAGSMNPDAAWQVLQFMAGPDGAQVVARSGTVPAYRSADAKAAWFEQSPTPPRSSEFLFSMPYSAVSTGLSLTDQKVLVAFLENLFQVVQGTATADTAYQQFMDARAKVLAGN